MDLWLDKTQIFDGALLLPIVVWQLIDEVYEIGEEEEDGGKRCAHLMIHRRDVVLPLRSDRHVLF